MNIKLYEYNKDKRIVNKVLNKEETITIIEPIVFNMFSPIIRINFNPLNNGKNYVFIEDFNNRYYFIERVEYVAHGLYNIILQCDVLNTYKNILNNTRAVLKQGKITTDKKRYNNANFSYDLDNHKVEYKFINNFSETGNNILITLKQVDEE